MSRFLSDEQRQIQQTSRAFAQKEIRPRRLEAYQGHEFITEMARRCGQLGMWRTLVPESRGGLGHGATTACVIFEELGRESPEMKILLEELLQRTKDITPAGDINYVRDAFSRGVYQLPVTITPA